MLTVDRAIDEYAMWTSMKPGAREALRASVKAWIKEDGGNFFFQNQGQIALAFFKFDDPVDGIDILLARDYEWGTEPRQ